MWVLNENFVVDHCHVFLLLIVYYNDLVFVLKDHLNVIVDDDDYHLDIVDDDYLLIHPNYPIDHSNLFVDYHNNLYY
jgi:hypothetical protein